MLQCINMFLKINLRTVSNYVCKCIKYANVLVFYNFHLRSEKCTIFVFVHILRFLFLHTSFYFSFFLFSANIINRTCNIF